MSTPPPPPSPAPDAPPQAAAKGPAPPLTLRAPAPIALRVRPGAAALLLGGAAATLAGAMAWALVVHPHLKAQSRQAREIAGSSEGQGVARPSPALAQQPATYDRLAPPELPPPRRIGGSDPPAPATATAAERSRHASHPRAAAAAGSRAGATETAARSGLFFEVAAAAPRAAAPATVAHAAPHAAQDKTYNGHRLTAPRSPFEIKAGAILPAALLTGVDTSRPGPVSAVLTEDVFDSLTGTHLLAPRGSRIIGRHEGASKYGDRRAFLAWDRLILPNGKSLVLDAEPGVDAQGAVGVEGRADRRLGPLALAVLASGAVTTLGQLARDDDETARSLLGDAGDAAAIEASRVGSRLVGRELDVAPSIRIEPGARVRLLITRDLVLEPYAP